MTALVSRVWQTRRTSESPLGTLRLIASAEALLAVLWSSDTGARVPLPAVPDSGTNAVLECAVEQLGEYIEGNRTTFDLPLAPRGTPFQLDVWQALKSIPVGETSTYGAIAQQLGRPHGAQAVGAANGRNPLSIIVPCHRVVGSDGSLTGFAGGLAAKRWLLAHERRVTGKGQMELF